LGSTERQPDRPVIGMAVDLGVELGDDEIARNVTLELGHVDAVGGESAERLV